jgi:hypothetical protein
VGGLRDEQLEAMEAGVFGAAIRAAAPAAKESLRAGFNNRMPLKEPQLPTPEDIRQLAADIFDVNRGKHKKFGECNRVFGGQPRRGK